RGVARVLASRSHPAGIFFFGRGGTSIFDCESQAKRTKFPSDAWPRGLAGFVIDRPRNFSALASFAPDLLHVRRHADPDRIGVRISVSARFHSSPHASNYVCADHDFVLGGICDLSTAAIEFRLSARWGSNELGAQLQRISCPLEQKFDPFVGI